MTILCINIDHVATLREARKIEEPDPVTAALICELAGASGITLHVREDRRHAKERDLALLVEQCKTRVNLEMAATDDMTDVALEYLPDQVTMVPENREEVTTEGGLDVASNFDRVKRVTDKLREAGIVVSLFIDPDENQIEASHKTGAEYIELHTGRYCEAVDEKEQKHELDCLIRGAARGKDLGLGINAGHGLNYRNVKPVARIKDMEELNIGQSIVAHAIFVGMERAVKEMLALIKEADPYSGK